MEDETATSPLSLPVSAGRKLAFPLLAAVLVMLTFITIPIAPVDLDTDADTSFSMAVNYSRLQGLHLGTDLVHTYGPLGHLIFIYFAPQIAGVRMLTDIALGYTVAAGLCLVAWQLHWTWRCGLLATFIFLITNVHPRIDLVIDVGTFSWGLLCCVGSGRRLKIAALMFVGLAVFSALGKNSLLFMNGLSLLLLAGVLATRGHWRVGIAMAMGFGLGVAAGWLAVGHSLANLRDSALNALSIVGGYNQAMGWDGLPFSLPGGLVVMTLSVAMVIFRSLGAFPLQDKQRLLCRLSLLAWLLALLFLDWKHGFVRGDIWHVAYFFGFVPVVALALEIFPSGNINALRWSRGLAIACCGLCLTTLQMQFFPPPSTSLKVPFRAFIEHTGDLLNPGAYQQRMNAVIDAGRRKASLPVLKKTLRDAPVDVFGQLQIYAILNGFNYHPRPVFQSYAAYNDHLMRLNEQFYLSTNAPDYLLFCLNPIDRRFPALEDARLFRDLLFNFEPVVREDPFLLLKSKSPTATRMSLLREGDVKPSEVIGLTEHGDTNLWLELDIKSSWLGKLRQIFYRPPTVRLAALRNQQGALLLRHRAPPVMLAAGFLASPFLSRNEDLADFYNGGSIVRPAGYSVEMLPGEEKFWQNPIHYRLYQIEKGVSPPK